MNINDKVSGIWAKFKYYIIGAAALIVIIVGLIFLGQWYASGKADELAKSLHEKFRQENQSIYDNLAVNQAEINKLKQDYSDQSEKITKLQKGREGGIINVIKSKDKQKIAGLYDNLVDSYTPPTSFGK